MPVNKYKALHELNELPTTISFNEKQVWQQIEAQLPKQKNRKNIPPYLFFAAAIVIMVLAFFTLQFLKPSNNTGFSKTLAYNKNQTAKNTITKAAVENKKRIKIIEVNRTPILQQKNNSIAIDTFITPIEIYQHVISNIDSSIATATTTSQNNMVVNTLQQKKPIRKFPVVHINELKETKQQILVYDKIEAPNSSQLENTPSISVPDNKSILFIKLKPTQTNTQAFQ